MAAVEFSIYPSAGIVEAMARVQKRNGFMYKTYLKALRDVASVMPCAAYVQQMVEWESDKPQAQLLDVLTRAARLAAQAARK